jgi:hypothetical protein
MKVVKRIFTYAKELQKLKAQIQDQQAIINLRNEENSMLIHKLQEMQDSVVQYE